MVSWIVFSIILLAIVLATVCFGAEITIPYLINNSTVNIDGQANDPGWVGQPTHVFGPEYLCFDNRVETTEVARMSWRLGCDDVCLFFYVEVKDRLIVTKPWANYNSADLCVIGFANSTTETVVILMPNTGMRMLTPGPGSEILRESAGLFATRIIPGGYAMEGSIPLSELGGKPSNGRIKIALVQRDWNKGQSDYSAIGNNEVAVFVTKGKGMWNDAEIATTPTIPVISVNEIKNMTEDMTVWAKQISWHVTYADANGFICEDPQQRIKALEVICTNPDRPVEKDIILSLMGRMMSNGKFQADIVEFLHGNGAFTTKPWGITSLALGPLTSNLRVKLTGSVKESFTGGFKFSDSGREIQVLWPTYIPVGTPVSVTGVVSRDPSGTTILLAPSVTSY